jgi:hypothetical protein
MTFDDLAKRRMIEKTIVSDDEIAEHLRVGYHDISLARTLSTQDLDWSFNIAYNGILQVSTAYMNHLGYRARGKAKHYNTFVFLSIALPSEYAHDIDRIQKMRAKRNLATYETRGIVSEREAKDIVTFAERFFTAISDLLPPHIVRAVKEADKESS